MSTDNSIELVIEGRRRDLGGFEVGRVLPWTKRRSVGPFVFFDHMGPKQMAANLPRKVDVRPHPHIGLSTITYLFAGEIVHRDSLGFHQVIRPGEVNWMTAGRGITHSERFETMREHGGLLHGIQAWIALPAADEETAPAFVHHAAEELPIERDGGVSRRVIAGKAFGKIESGAHAFADRLCARRARGGREHAIDSGRLQRASRVRRGRHGARRTTRATKRER